MANRIDKAAKGFADDLTSDFSKPTKGRSRNASNKANLDSANELANDFLGTHNKPEKQVPTQEVVATDVTVTQSLTEEQQLVQENIATKEKKKVGRKPKPNKKASRITLLMDEEWSERIRSEADKRSMTVNAFLMNIITEKLGVK